MQLELVFDNPSIQDVFTVWQNTITLTQGAHFIVIVIFLILVYSIRLTQSGRASSGSFEPSSEIARDYYYSMLFPLEPDPTDENEH